MHVACMGQMTNVCRVWKCEGRIPLGRPKCSWEDNIKIDLKEIGREGVEWIHRAKDRDHWWSLVNVVMNLWIPYKVGNVLTSW